MPGVPVAIGLALSAALFHSTWNVLVKTSGDPLRLSTRAQVLGVAILTPLILALWLLSGRPGVPAQAWLLAGVSGLLELAYFVFLSRAYSRGELSAVYPLARGTAPLLAVGAGLVVLRERLTPVELLGVALLLGGIWCVRRPTPAGEATLPALLTGVCIASYSAVDAAGVHLTAPWLYGWLLSVATAIALAAWTAFLPGQSATEEAPPSWRLAALVGSLMMLTYFLVLFAFRLAPLAIVSPVRESAIVLVTIWGVWKLREREGIWLRLIGASVIVVGVGLLAAV
jgi:drug/metabolite transporter (DMT)-like permease